MDRIGKGMGCSGVQGVLRETWGEPAWWPRGGQVSCAGSAWLWECRSSSPWELVIVLLSFTVGRCIQVRASQASATERQHPPSMALARFGSKAKCWLVRRFEVSVSFAGALLKVVARLSRAPCD